MKISEATKISYEVICQNKQTHTKNPIRASEILDIFQEAIALQFSPPDWS